MGRIWAGVDAGKTHHHCVVLDVEGRKLLSRRVANDEPELLALLAEVAGLGEEVTWAVDLADGGACLLIAILAGHDQRLLYIPGRTVNSASASYRGEGKTDARDALVIADQARMRRDLNPLRPHDEYTVELKLLTARRADLVCDRTRVACREHGTT
jgi:transposase